MVLSESETSTKEVQKFLFQYSVVEQPPSPMTSTSKVSSVIAFGVYVDEAPESAEGFQFMYHNQHQQITILIHLNKWTYLNR